MSNVWGTRYRLVGEELALLRQDHINQRGQCQFCGATRWQWRFGHRRRRCTVYAALDHAMGQTVDVLWWKLFEAWGQEWSLDEVREWVEARRECETADAVPDGSPDPVRGSGARPAVSAHGRDRVVDDAVSSMGGDDTAAE